MNQSEQINELAAALSAAQGEFPILEKRSKAYNYRYADLAEILGAIQAPLKNHGLSIVSQTSPNAITAKLMHSSGQWLSTDVPLMFKEDGKINAMQAMGSAITYGRRYAICCLLNLAADKESDDDAVAALPKPQFVKERVQLPSESPPIKIQPGQLSTIKKWLEEFPEEEEKILKGCGIERLEDMAWRDVPRTLSYFKKLSEKGA